MLGTGFWAQYQLAAWQELPQAQCVALYNRTLAKAAALGERFGVSAVYDDVELLLDQEQLDFVDIVTDVNTHSRLVALAACRRIPVICQKPLAPSWKEAQAMVAACAATGTPLFVHENWRWQAPLRELKRLLSQGAIGTPYRARIDMISGFAVFANQPFLAELDQFILTDMGSHILDVARFLFGEADLLYCQIHRVHPHIRGEDVATVMLRMNEGRTTVLCEMSYAENPLERECFPETLVFVEGDRGSLELTAQAGVRLTTAEGTLSRRIPPPQYAWCDPAYELVQSSIVACHANLLAALQGVGNAETTGEDNLRTARLVFGAYESARARRVIELDYNRPVTVSSGLV